MPRLEVFFDYGCPFCFRGHKYLTELLPDYPHMQVEWRPCEVNPGRFDLCIQGMFYARDAGADLPAYHARMYDLKLRQRADTGNAAVLAAAVSDLLYAEAFRAALESGRYRQTLREANDYAYQRSGVWAVPAYRMGDRRLDAVMGLGVTKARLQAFLDGAQN